MLRINPKICKLNSKLKLVDSLNGENYEIFYMNIDKSCFNKDENFWNNYINKILDGSQENECVILLRVYDINLDNIHSLLIYDISYKSNGNDFDFVMLDETISYAFWHKEFKRKEILDVLIEALNIFYRVLGDVSIDGS